MGISSYLLANTSTCWSNILPNLVAIGIKEIQVISIMFIYSLVVVKSTSLARQETGETLDGSIFLT